MKIIKLSPKCKLKNIVLALGNFDGVHIGHKKIIRDAVRYAGRNKLSCYAMTFDPHPQQVVQPKARFKLLTTFDERIMLMSDLGVDGVIMKRFDRKTQSMSPSQFVRDILAGKLNAKKVFIGYDFAFGRHREGDSVLLSGLGRQYGFTVSAVKPIKHRKVIVKSSEIRKLIIYGKFNEAVMLLGHPYVLHGRVISGRGAGRELGFPTANLSIDPDKLIPGYGVYFGKIDIDGKIKKCLINIGSRPTFSGDFAIEVHILGFKGHLLGKKLNVGLIRKIRDEKQFASIEELKKQIEKDVALARKIKA